MRAPPGGAAALFILLSAIRVARAQEVPPAPDDTAPAQATADDDAAAADAEAEADAAAIADQIRQNEQLVAQSRQTMTFGGYVDFGFFAPKGNGAGYVQDFGHVRYPELAGYEWVFLGDILAPAVNTRGEAADLGDAPGVDRFDSIDSRGAPGFVVSEVNLRFRATPAPNAIISASVNLVPRTGRDFALGDFLDVDIAQLEWLPTASQRTSLFFGKMDSVIGIEYRERKADRRFGITPTLLARYTTGTALGLKMRTKLGRDDWLVLAAALTNGSNTTEQFHFYDEVDSNLGKTASGRLSVRPPLPFALEIGFSGSYGAQDRTTSNVHPMWFLGPDLLASIGPVDVKAQWLKGRAPGDAAQGAYVLDLHGGGYLEIDAMITSSLGMLGRAEYRDAFVALGAERAYVTQLFRATFGVRYVMTRWALFKEEFLMNREYGSRMPNVTNDVFTTSLVLSY